MPARITTDDIDPNLVLTAAVDKLKTVVVLGWENDENGTMYVAGSTSDGPDLLWLVEKFKHKLLAGDYSAESD